VLRGNDGKDLEELERQGLSVRAISLLTGLDRKAIHKYLMRPEVPVYGPRVAQPSKLGVFKSHLEQGMRAGVWNARVLPRRLRVCGYTGGYTILTDWRRPQRASALGVEVRRSERLPGKQAQNGGAAQRDAEHIHLRIVCDLHSGLEYFSILTVRRAFR
jgi:transposase